METTFLLCLGYLHLDLDSLEQLIKLESKASANEVILNVKVCAKQW